MTHRFPLHEAVFPSLLVTPKTQEKFVKTAQVQLTRALHDYDRYHKWQASRPPSLRYQLHPAMWRPVKTCEQLTVYRRVPVDDAVVTAPTGTRRRARSRTLEAARLANAAAGSASSAPKVSTMENCSWMPDRGSVPTLNKDWSMPTLLQVGTVEGTLDEVMYGSVTFTATDALIKTAYTESEVVDADTLSEIQGPTLDEPFRFLGLKWVVKATSVKAFVWPRDLTYLEATGILNREGGERVGYHLMHSVDLGKGFESLEKKRIVRGRVSSCYFYHQTAPNTVEVYMKTNFEPNGSVHEGVALMSAANSLTYCLRSALCARMKKLTWMIAHPQDEEAEIGSSRQSTVRVRKRNDCGICTRPLGTFARGSSCRICNTRACSSCCVKKKLSFPGKSHKVVEERSAVLCTHCLTRARKLNTFEIAQLEVQEREQHKQRRSRVTEVSRSARSNSRAESTNRNLRHTSPDEARPSGQPSARAPQRQTEPRPAPLSWDFSAENEAGANVNTRASAKPITLLSTQTERRQTSSRTIRDRKHVGKTLDSPVLMAGPKSTGSDEPIPVASNRPTWDVDSDAEDEDDYDCSVVSAQPVSLHPECEGTDNDSLPEAVVQYAWGEVVPSPTHGDISASPAPWPSPPSSPLQSPTMLPTESEVTWPVSEGEQAKVWNPPTVPQIPRIHAGASTQEVLAQFAELCNAAENVYHQARKHTVTHMDPPIAPTRRQTTRLDMSALD